MNKSFYTGAVGAFMQNQRMNVQANNLANVNNYGYKAERATFHHLMYNYVDGIGGDRLPKGSGTKMVKASVDFEQGGLSETGYLFDYDIAGDGFFALYDLSSGEVSFTRDGDFRMARFEIPPEERGLEIDPETGELIDSETGEPVEAAPLPEINPETGNIVEWRLTDNEGRCVLDSEGNFIVIDPLNKEADLDVGVFDYRVYDGMSHIDSERFVPTEKNGDLYVGTGTVRRGYLERSNVDITQEFIKVIESQRAYSYALKMVQTSDEIEQTINGLPN